MCIGFFDRSVNAFKCHSFYIPKMERKSVKEIPVSKSQSDVWRHTSALMQDIKSKTEPYIVNFQGVDLTILPGVFRPTTETLLLGSTIQVLPTDRVLDITTGCGAAAAIAGLQGASGLAVDINPQAVVNANMNFQSLGISMQAIESNLFQNVPEELFDVILCNPPYYEGTPTEPLEYAIFGGRNFLVELFTGMKQYLKPTGKALITYAEWAGDVDFFEKTATEKGYAFSVIGGKESDDRQRVYRLYEVTLPTSNPPL